MVNCYLISYAYGSSKVRSDVWKHYDKIDDGVPKAKCTTYL